MLKASALYMVIVVAMVIGVLCSAMIVAAYCYKSVYLQNFRYDELKNNLNSGINLLLTKPDDIPLDQTISLYGSDNDSVKLQQYNWGLYDVAIAQSFRQMDTLSKAFLTANMIDSAKWNAVYLIDEDRPLSVSGATHIKGKVFIPKAGVKQAYVNNQAYTGDKRLVIGTKKDSEKKLPPLTEARLQKLEQYLKMASTTGISLLVNNSIEASFLANVKTINFRKNAQTLNKVTLQGRIILFSDTTITIDSSAYLENVLVFAPVIIVKTGFKGICQLFASDSIHVEENGRFEYPSVLGLIPGAEKRKLIPIIAIDKDCAINGVVFSYQKNKDNPIPVISIGSNTTIKGQIYADGLLNLKDKVAVYGSVFTNRFTYQSSFTHYENYLINVDIDASKLSPYYLSSNLIPVTTKERKVLQWLQ